jgi:hypothetical protein
MPQPLGQRFVGKERFSSPVIVEPDDGPVEVGLQSKRES